MKSVLNMFKVKNAEDDNAVTTSSQYDSEHDFQDFDDLDEDYYEEDEDSSGDVFEDFTNKVQSLLDDGAMSLEIAEDKTAELEEWDSGSQEYRDLVEEIKIAQAEARQNFDDAEFLIKRANEILENNAN